MNPPYENKYGCMKIVENVLDKLYSHGIKNYWNFSHYDINARYNDTMVENVHLSDSLMTLCYRMNNN